MTNKNKIWYNVKVRYGEVSEWFKELVLKTSDSARNRGFESHPLRHFFINELITSWSGTQAAEEDGLLNR